MELLIFCKKENPTKKQDFSEESQGINIKM
jgi:hypothetical protein